MASTRYDLNPVPVSGGIWLARQIFGPQRDGSCMVNVCIKSEAGELAAIDSLFCDANGVYSYKDKSIGTIDSPEFEQFLKKYQSGPDLSQAAARPVPQNDKELYQQVSASYSETKSIKRSAKLLGISEEKTRRILFTLGEYTCELHEKIVHLLREGKSLDDVSAAVGLNRHKIHSYLPYSN
jgi:hypothetical protein